MEFLAGNRIIGTDAERLSEDNIGSPATEEIYDEITGRTDVSIWIIKASPNHSNGEGRYVGLQIQNNTGGQALVGKGIQKIKVRVSKSSGASGTYRVGIMNSSGTVKGFSDQNVSGITTSPANYDHTMNNVVTLAVGDVIFIKFVATGSVYLHTNDHYPFGNYNSAAYSPRSITTGDTNWVTVVGGDGNRFYMMNFDFSPASAILTVTDGSIFYAKDTNKEYVLNNNTWTEL